MRKQIDHIKTNWYPGDIIICQARKYLSHVVVGEKNETLLIHSTADEQQKSGTNPEVSNRINGAGQLGDCLTMPQKISRTA